MKRILRRLLLASAALTACVLSSCCLLSPAEPEPVVYTAASFKSWLLAEEFPFYYTPNRLRRAHPATGSMWYGLEKEKSPAQDINVFTERLDLARLAALCYGGEGELWFVPGERVPRDHHGLIAGSVAFQPYQPARFLTEGGLDLSVIASNVLLLYQLYLDDYIVPRETEGGWWFTWSCQAELAGWKPASSGSPKLWKASAPSGLRLNQLPAGLAARYAVLQHIDPAWEKQGIPAIPCRLRETEEVVLCLTDELRGEEGNHPGPPSAGFEESFRYATAAYEGTWPAELWGKRKKVADACDLDAAYEAWIHRVKGSAVRRIACPELWTASRGKHFLCMARDPQFGERSSLIRYEYFSCFRELDAYYEAVKLRGSLRTQRHPRLIYRR